MIRRLGNLKGWHAAALNLSRCGLRILAALVFLFVLVGANPSGSAQAASAGQEVQISMVVIPSKRYVCANASMTFRVYVVFSPRPDPEVHGDRLSGVAVDATVADLSIGTITPDRLMTGFDTFDPEVAEFTFTAGNDPGNTTIFFEGLIRSYTTTGSSTAGTVDEPIYVEKPVQVEVRKCSYKISVMFFETFPMVMAWTGWADPIRMNADTPTQFSGATAFFYTQRLLIQMPKCNFDISVMPTTVNYQGELVGDWLNLSITIQNTTNAVTNPCVSAVGMGELGVRMVDDSVPAVGGVITHPDPPYGSFTIYVVRADE